MTFKTDSIHKQKQVDNSRMLVDHKKQLLSKLVSSNEANMLRKANCLKLIEQAKSELDKINADTM